ncbi:hypothetical protein BKA69DRAFT_1069976 [Paraphysoderma sedebokerense]|nr:hypothetical protein BKA69DRAFT_1069976 [Paraphysoderma sedebokerense]
MPRNASPGRTNRVYKKVGLQSSSVDEGNEVLSGLLNGRDIAKSGFMGGADHLAQLRESEYETKESQIRENGYGSDNSENYLVIGGEGFLGRHIVEALLLHSSPSSQTPQYSLSSSFAQLKRYGSKINGDITENKGAVSKCDQPQIHILDLPPTSRYPPHPNLHYHSISLLSDFTPLLTQYNIKYVFHTASPPHGLTRDKYYSVNVVGTKNVIECCRKAGVKKLVYTSSTAVLFEGKDLKFVEECDDDAENMLNRKFFDAYTETKALAENIVLSSNNMLTENSTSATPLLTCAIRPAAIFGPRDNQLIPGFVDTVKDGHIRFRIGANTNLFDFTFVDNIVYAHLLAMEKMGCQKGIDGEAFNITNDQPVPFWSFQAHFVRRLLPPSHPVQSYIHQFCIPYSVALFFAIIVDFIVKILSPIVTIHPAFTSFRVGFVCKWQTYDISKAKKQLGYSAVVTIEEGIERTVEWVRTVDKWKTIWQLKTDSDRRNLLHGHIKANEGKDGHERRDDVSHPEQVIKTGVASVGKGPLLKPTIRITGDNMPVRRKRANKHMVKDSKDVDKDLDFNLNWKGKGQNRKIKMDAEN